MKLSAPFLRFLVIAAILGSFAAPAMAFPRFWTLLNGYYKFAPGSDAANAKCGNCHVVKPPLRNPYGKALETLINKSPTGDLTVDMLKQVEPLDSDGDGFSNGVELKAGFNPGDPNSHPPKGTTASTAAASGSTGATSSPSPSPSPSPSESAPLIPKHTFHPALIHFPIALFIFGTFLEFLGLYRKDDKIREVAKWNLIFGAISTAVVVPTGFIAALRLGFGLGIGGSAFEHWAFAIGSTILMVITAVWRSKAVPRSALYLALIVAACIGLGITGHLGGNLVGY